MGINIHRGRIVCDRRWPDGSRFTRVCANKTEAKGLLARVEASIVDGSWPEMKEKLKLRDRDVVTLEEFSETYIEEYAKARNKKKAWKRKVTAFKSLNRILGRLNLESVSPVHLHNYVKKRNKEGVSNATINRELTIVKHMLSYAAECGIIDMNRVEKFKNLKEERKERPRFSDEQINKVIGKARKECRPLFIFIRETGCRREEALSLKHEQVQEDSGLVVFNEDTKSRKYRYVPLTKAAAEAVKVLPRLEECEYVFYNPKTKTRWFDCRKAWERAREAAGVEELQIKDLRRHYAINLAENGADMHDIQQVLGHASVATTETHYAQFSPEHSVKKVLRVLRGGQSEPDTKRIQSETTPDSDEKGSGVNPVTAVS